MDKQDQIITKVAKQLSEAIGPDQLLKIVSKAITDTVTGYSAESTIKQIIQPAINEAAAAFVQKEECKQLIRNAVKKRISGLIESSIVSTLGTLVNNLKK